MCVLLQSTDALEYSSESEDGLVTPIPAPIPAPIPMEVNQSTIELQTEVTAAADISLASEPPVYKVSPNIISYQFNLQANFKQPMRLF